MIKNIEWFVLFFLAFCGAILVCIQAFQQSIIEGIIMTMVAVFVFSMTPVFLKIINKKEKQQ